MNDVPIDQHLDAIDWSDQQDSGEVLLSPAWEVFVLGVSILSVFNLLVVWFVRNPDIDMVFIIMDAILTIVFLLDLMRRLAVAEDRRRYLIRGWGWIDVVSAFPLLRIFRLLRIVRMVRIMGRLGGPARAFKAFFSNKAAGGLLSVLLIGLLVMEFGALLILMVERGAPDANIETAQDSIWYMLVTMSTVGYGDQYPVTDVGRIIGSLIIIVGVGVFGTLTGFLANFFLTPSEVSVVVAPPGAREEVATLVVPDEDADEDDAADEDSVSAARSLSRHPDADEGSGD
jgi:voltage-gated potassium channel